MLLKRANLILPVTASDTLSIGLLVNDDMANGRDMRGEMQEAPLREMILTMQVKVYHSHHQTLQAENFRG